MPSIVHKRLGETPLEALERYRAEKGVAADVPLTYAGRLDPMAEGALLVLEGEECKRKDAFLGFDKEYEVEIVFGIATDSYDGLGLATAAPAQQPLPRAPIEGLERYVGAFEQEYPPYSSKTVGGTPLHELARAGRLPEKMPVRRAEICSISLIGWATVSAQALKARLFEAIDRVRGDFRQAEAKKRWDEALGDPSMAFSVAKIRVACSSGTYMRSLADRMGKDAGCGAFALSIKRTRIYERRRA
ncbi:MAG: hypothetical protein KGI69_01470 [Patescibacteria group bacterium]|nr:hypothetical protein [Patescibacteria group bacterium]